MSPKQTLGPHSRDAIITTEIKNFDSTTQIHIYPSPRDIFTTEVFLRVLQEIFQLDIGGIYKNGIDDLICKAENRDTDVDNKCMDTNWDRR